MKSLVPWYAWVNLLNACVLPAISVHSFREDERVMGWVCAVFGAFNILSVALRFIG